MKNKEVREITLAALLHDIGKFAWRGGEKIPEDFKRRFCPENQGKFSHAHAAYSYKAIKNIWKDLERVAQIAAYHHAFFKAPEELRKHVLMVTVADILSSAERTKEIDDEQKFSVKEQRLLSPFSLLHGAPGKKENFFFPLKRLQEDVRNLFPSQASSLSAGEDYRKHWQDFSQLAALLDPTHEAFEEQLLRLLEVFALFVPSAVYRARPDVSLYHHLRTSAAIAACLAVQDLEQSFLEELYHKRKEAYRKPLFFLLGGDISGIQRFIYEIVSTKALKALRGRSLYLQLLTEVVARFILRELGLPLSCLYLCAGGHFLLLLPISAKKHIEHFQKRIDQVLLPLHKGELAFIIGGVELSSEDLSEKFPEKKDELGTYLAREKRRPFRLLISQKEKFLGPFPVEGKEKGCEVCGRELSYKDKETGLHCKLCQSLEELGRKAAKAKFLYWGSIEPHTREPQTIFGVFRAFGVDLSFETELSSAPLETYILNSPQFFGIKKGTEFLITPSENGGEPVILRGFCFLTSNIPFNGHEPKTLEDFANEAQGIKKWGVLVADVDNLGVLFRERLPREEGTVSRLSFISYLLQFFFGAFVPFLAQKNGKVAVIYAGGDDLFLLGSWDALLPFAKEVQENFHRFFHKRLTISGGIFFAPRSKYPISQAAKLAKDEEELAKAREKNAVAIFSRRIVWEELKELENFRDLLLTVWEKTRTKSIYNLFYQVFSELEPFAESGRVELYPIWRFLYQIKRLKERYNKAQKELHDLEVSLTRNLFRPHPLVVGLRIADYLTRSEKEGGNNVSFK